MLTLTIDQAPHLLVPIKEFRSQFDLPEDFSLATFEKEDWEGHTMGEGSGNHLSSVKERILASIPGEVGLRTIMRDIDALSEIFHQELLMANEQIGLRPLKLDFTVAGFRDILQSAGYQLIQLLQRHRDAPLKISESFDFPELYHNWLDASVRLSHKVHKYKHEDQEFLCQVINYPYGRVGLRVKAAGETFYIIDTSLACPAADYMEILCEEVCEAICKAFVKGVQHLN